MNKKYLFGIGIVLAVLLVFTASAIAGPNTVYFETQHSSADPDGTVDVVVWFNLTDVYGVSPEEGYGFSILGMNFTWNPDVLDVISCERPAGDPWDAGWTIHKWHGNSWYVLAEYNPWNSGPPYGLEPGVYPVANFTLKGINPGVTDLTFIHYGDPGAVRYCEMVDAIGDPYPEQVWEDGTFTCEGEIPPPEPDTFTKDLVTGWNLVSLPLTNETDMTVANIINASLSGSYDALNKYDAATHNFVALGSSDTLENGVGYFIHMTVDDTWTYQGTVEYTSMTASLAQGLNCVGWVNETDSALPGALDSISGNYRYVARWDASSQSYEVYLPGAPAVFNDFTTMDRGEGYFIAATADCTLTYP